MYKDFFSVVGSVWWWVGVVRAQRTEGIRYGRIFEVI